MRSLHHVAGKLATISQMLLDAAHDVLTLLQ